MEYFGKYLNRNNNLFNEIIFFASSFFLASLLIGCDKKFWNLPKLPEIGDVKIEFNDFSAFKVSALISNSGYCKIERVGFCWSHDGLPDIQDNVVYLNNDNDILNATISRDINLEYHVRAFVENEIGIAYSGDIRIPWPGSDANIPIVFLEQPMSIGFNEVQIGANINSDGGLNIIERGFCFSKYNSLPVISDNSVVVTGESFQTSISSLEENTSYYVRAYARNLQGLGYSQTVTLTTRNYYQIGEIGPAGGMVFYSKSDNIGGWNFLEAAPNDLTNLSIWSDDDQYTGVIGTSIGLGDENTDDIVQLLGAVADAAFSCYNYGVNGFSNWYLPSRDELLAMRSNLALVGLGEFNQSSYYWSSSEDLIFPTNAWGVSMNSNGTSAATFVKNQNFAVRPIRKFQ